MRKLYPFLISFFLIYQLPAQTTLVSSNEGSLVTIEGTSSVHDWESKVEEFTSSITFSVVGEENVLQIDLLEFTAVTKSIKSGKSVMDRKTRGALKEGDYPNIVFSYNEVIEQTPDSITIAGNLDLAGTSQPIEVTASYFVLEDGSLNVVGIQEINMRDYGINPPTAMMGTLKTGETVNVEFDLIFEDS